MRRQRQSCSNRRPCVRRITDTTIVVSAECNKPSQTHALPFLQSIHGGAGFDSPGSYILERRLAPTPLSLPAGEWRPVAEVDEPGCAG